jgi:hypothetical protein
MKVNQSMTNYAYTAPNSCENQNTTNKAAKEIYQVAKSMLVGTSAYSLFNLGKAVYSNGLTFKDVIKWYPGRIPQNWKEAYPVMDRVLSLPERFACDVSYDMKYRAGFVAAGILGIAALHYAQAKVRSIYNGSSNNEATIENA